MKQTITLYEFRRQFSEIRPNSFSYDGLEALYNYLVGIENETEEMEFDVIALCGDFVEYENIIEYNKHNDASFESIEDIEKRFGNIIIPINNKAFIIGVI